MAHGSPGSAKLPARSLLPQEVPGTPCPSPAGSKRLPCPGMKGEMHLWEASRLAGEKHGPGGGLMLRQRGPAQGARQTPVPPAPARAQPRAAWPGDGRAGQASPPACAALKTSSPESCQRWQLENTPEKSRRQFCHWPNYSPLLRGHLQTKQR